MDQTRNHFQRNSNWNALYTFSGKEKDVETGYGYFGARYYDSGLSIWLSVDPMSDKSPSMSPYNYCANNPANYVDPFGLDTINVNIATRTVTRISVEGSKTHTFNINYDDKTLKSYELQINLNGQVEIPDEGYGYGRYGEKDLNGDHYLTVEAAAALFGLAAELKYFHNGRIDFGDMSDICGGAPGGNHKSHGGVNGGSGRCADFRYLDGNFKSFYGSTSNVKFSFITNNWLYQTAYLWGFSKNYSSTVWPSCFLSNMDPNRKFRIPFPNHTTHGHFTFKKPRK